jgi:hypothetical protein
VAEVPFSDESTCFFCWKLKSGSQASRSEAVAFPGVAGTEHDDFSHSADFYGCPENETEAKSQSTKCELNPPSKLLFVSYGSA